MNAVLRGLLVFLSAIALWGVAPETRASLGHEDGSVALEHRAHALDGDEDGDAEPDIRSLPVETRDAQPERSSLR